ncbi:MAG: RNA methyltransferase [Crocinitomicaceae bacterium]|nr:RNA methyltransferase [Crocinitomicaceae bacterium]|tara:strand:+ start:13991 stop:14530 length:540 start_codon:yes stop_codon:yes gene_type:complete
MNRKLKLEELNRDSVEAFKAKKKNGIYIVLDNVRSLSNVGSIFRTADAFLINEILLCGITACPPHREITKTALGSTESVAWQYFDRTLDALDYLRSKNCNVYALEQAENSIELNKLDLNKDDSIALILGHEVNGVEQAVIDQCDGCIEIPQFGTKHSLNVSASGSIAIWEIWSKKQKAL